MHVSTSQGYFVGFWNEFLLFPTTLNTIAAWALSKYCLDLLLMAGFQDIPKEFADEAVEEGVQQLGKLRLHEVCMFSGLHKP